ncbi:MAG: NUDIX domain-containing protein [Actinomycetota bacterium]|nr:NUDIX domain-containing protein [Actinomycetota bacterium]
MSVQNGVMARGPWDPSRVSVSWRAEAFEPAASATEAADEALDELRRRGSPSHDGLAARLHRFVAHDDRLELELQPARWALRLISDPAAQPLSALCVVRDAEGCWLAGRRAAWLASWAGRWALGAGGAVEVAENPAETLARELAEEWSVAPERLTVEALVGNPGGMVLLIGQAWLAAGANVTPDPEHDQYAWWPPDVGRWPPEADAPLRLVGEMLGATGA